MKRLLLTVALLAAWVAQGQPIQRNSYTTNATGRTPNVLPTSTNTIYPLMVLNPDGSGGDRQVLFSEYLTLTGTNTTLGGNLSLNGRTNKLSIVNDTLHLDGVPVTSSESAPVNNFYVTNLFAVSGKNNTLIITNALSLLSLKTNLLAVDANGLVTNANYGTGIAWDTGTLTLSSTATGGASTWVPVTTLAFSTTNVTIPLNGGTNFVVTLTNGSTGFFTYSGAPASTSTNTTFTLTVIQDADGLGAMNWNTNFYFMGGVVPVITTNALAEDVFTITLSARVAGAANVTWNPDFKR